MHQYGNAGILRAHSGDMRWKESLMNRTVPFPKDDPAVAQLHFRIAAKLFKRIPHRHFVQSKTKTVGGVTSEMLVRKEQNLVAAIQRPAKNGRGIGRRANRSAMTSAKCLYRRG